MPKIIAKGKVIGQFKDEKQYSSWISNKVNYLMKDEFKKVSLDKDWNLLVPHDIQSCVNGEF